ncbi:hypothetical protein Hanom_Chr17g01555861 [Helianthus anomalus]
MVFVPGLEGDHYYLIVFDLEEERIYLIDHLGDRQSDVLLRDNEEYILKITPFKVLARLPLLFIRMQKDIFVEYLKFVSHPKATVMRSSVIR